MKVWLGLPFNKDEGCSYYTCAQCNGKFLRGWTTEEADAEALARFGIENASSKPDLMVQVCDDCYEELVG